MSTHAEINVETKPKQFESSGHVARNLLREIPVLSPQHSNSHVHGLLHGLSSDAVCLPVVEDGRPLGLINRNVFTTGMARPFAHDLFAKKSCHTFMNAEPIVVNQHTSIEELSHKMVGNGRSNLNDGFIITDDDGKYMGVGTGEDLIKLVVELQAEKNRVIMDSIHYASTIQRSFLRPSDEDMASVLDDYFMHWEPRDKVGGDYYFCEKFEDGFFLALIDCTGHGVPGAFMTLIVASFLGHILREHDRRDPATLLAVMNKKLKVALRQLKKHEWEMDGGLEGEGQSDDGMDTAFCWIEPGKMTYAGAKTPIFFMDEGASEVQSIEGDRKGVGYIETPMDNTWTNREIDLPGGRCIYLTTDGVIDQIGQDKRIAFGKRRLSDLIKQNHHKAMPSQRDAVLQAFYAWQGTQRRRDDVCFFGFRA
ncbi:SpoIIE family protein phosphatase [Candidatus Methylospira mobilis]|uniref:SpoIIE family protein phosphatase n=1 Tax=Candidatus Methylospira mobilis TaxID=1808979 RepID=A0A5Q0BL44_9GAMM|nr:SpoIIE family protein phosphatase [Candidatus Methylospira mobilis]QFY42837.1 SpoIIE family protein phosphatase [Candidatus Methylospira mobilis]WNV04101.1 SpoIIE family protein phosphatase [Candidatus Methylospira mobilis]